MRTLLIDNYDSYTYNLFHLLGQVNGEEPVVVTNDAVELPDLDGFDNVVISPGPGHPARARDFGISLDVLRRASAPVLGVCLGHQGLAVSEGGRVVPAPEARHGHVERVTHQGDAFFAGIPREFGAVRYHSLCVAEPLPDDLEPIARAEDGVIMALRHRRLPRWGVQFHPESIETEYGLRMMANFRDLTTAAQGRRSFAVPVVAPSAPVREQSPAGQRRYSLQVRELDRAVDTEAAFDALYSGSTNAFWLDSARVERGLSRFSFLGDAAGPLAETVRYRVAERAVVVDGPAPAVHAGTVFDYLQRESERRVVDAPPLPFDFTGGYVGYFGYELKADCGSKNRHTAETPDAVWLFADRFLAVDHEQDRTYLLALGTDETTRAAAEDWLTGTAEVLEGLRTLPEPAPVPAASVEPFLAKQRADYVQDVRASQEYLLQGESYEICLTNVAEVPATDGGWETYRRLRRLNPAPYAAYLHLDGIDVACSSPERFLKITADRVAEAKPIKGTAPRGATPAEDEAARAELVSSAKTRAENLMIVDLLRNDLGRVCELGSVEVPVLMAAESYATVHQLVSTIRGTLKADADTMDCVRACFPGGSMTGAPKLRTLDIIESLEQRARGIYSGSIGYLACNGSADLNIVIRTMVRTGEHWQLGAGGAIVLDSDPDEEYDEMLLKASAPARALRAPEPQATVPAAAPAAPAAPADSNGSELA
ncbi:aminodeoxychorismate synthase component I [Kitasatospora cathayae]|uniref:aminodeoxychorismate synthase n=1 Tax=Kitasatospora cathayae TaxID=3004092 RepID=A0ABY7QFY3_9ACTN|nr:aminodeoxychorismate synthase component I [Kitasatospora sp. HUAS 3-15]WBP91481.1 aminodeoxychorismate synthase component I [Kitasatospora sp. HUAS 3-15]